MASFCECIYLFPLFRSRYIQHASALWKQISIINHSRYPEDKDVWWPKNVLQTCRKGVAQYKWFAIKIMFYVENSLCKCKTHLVSSTQRNGRKMNANIFSTYEVLNQQLTLLHEAYEERLILASALNWTLHFKFLESKGVLTEMQHQPFSTSVFS